MSGDFLPKAADSAARNVVAWKERFHVENGPGGASGVAFLPGDAAGCGVIAEIKMKSPSAGELMGGKDPVKLLGEYESGGAQAVSVVVEEHFFGGSPELFMEITSNTVLPVLWKDFVVDEFQIELAARLGASAILLIESLLSGSDLGIMIQRCRTRGLRPLVEVHGEAALKRAIDSGADLVGVNNRNLKTLEVDLEMSERLAGQIGDGISAVAESGMKTPEDVARMARLGYRAVLIGEALVTSDSVEPGLRAMVEAGEKR